MPCPPCCLHINSNPLVRTAAMLGKSTLAVVLSFVLLATASAFGGITCNSCACQTTCADCTVEIFHFGFGWSSLGYCEWDDYNGGKKAHDPLQFMEFSSFPSIHADSSEILGLFRLLWRLLWQRWQHMQHVSHDLNCWDVCRSCDN